MESAAGGRFDRRVEASRRARAPEGGEDGEWRYRLAASIPPYQLPLMPVRFAGSAGMRLQRGRLALPEGGTSGAMGRLLAPETRLLLREEALPACGLRVERAWELSRGPDGRVHLWVGRRRRLGQGDVKAGVVFDAVEAG